MLRKILYLIVLALLPEFAASSSELKPIYWGSESKIKIANSSFENTDGKQVEAWGSNTGVQPIGKIMLKSGGAQSGNNYLQFSNNEGQVHQFYSATPLAVKGNDVVNLKAYVKGKGAFKLALYAYNNSNVMLDCLEPEATTIDCFNWLKKNFQIKIPEKVYPKGKIARVNVAVIIGRNSNIQLDTVSGQLKIGSKNITKPQIISGLNNDPNPQKVGERPYEMAGRKERRKPLVTFVDASQWATECHDAHAALYRSNEQQLFRNWCGKLVYRPTGPKPSVIVRLKRPVKIPEPWDCINAWNWGNVWCWISEKQNRPLHISALILGADGEEHEIKLGNMYYEYWHLMHRKLVQKIARPATFVGFKITNLTNRNKNRTVYLGPVYFYEQSLKKLNFEKWPEKLPFPTRKDTVLPTNKTVDFKNTVQLDDNVAVFKYTGSDVKLQYRLNLAKEFLNGLEVICGKRRFKPCENAQIILSNGRAKLQLIRKRLNDGILKLKWNCIFGKTQTFLTAEIKIKQKSLIISFEELSRTGKIAELKLGRAMGLKDPELIMVPYISYGWNFTDPHLLRDGKLFVFSQLDWYVSDGSRLIGANKAGEHWAEYNGGVEYIPKTDGKRNPLKERLFLTVSPDVQEVFPNIPNPPSTMRKAQCRRQWRTKGGGNYLAELNEAKRLRALGMNQVTIRYHEQQWRDTGESYTFKLNAAPKRGGNTALKKLVSDVQHLGWRVGLYTNYSDLAPVNSFWDEDYVAHTADDNWRNAWCRCYLPKPLFAVEMEAKLAPQIKKIFGTSHVYCDVKTAVPPSDYVDFDARVPGAAKFRKTFECFGRLLYNESFAYNGPVYSEGGCHWMYAGLVDGNYGQMFGVNATAQPLFPDFDLLKIHPLEMDAGMGDPGMFNRGNNKLMNYKQFIATTLAYGHLGVLGAGQTDAELMEIYYMLQPLQEYYMMIPVKSIAYECKGKMLDSSAALVDGGWRGGRLHVSYKNGFNVWINGSKKLWTVDTGKTGTWTLPTWGVAAWTKDGKTGSVYAKTGAVIGNSLLEQKRLVQFNYSENSYYFNSSNGFVYGRKMAGEGAAALKKESAGWELIPAREFKEFGFSPELVGLDGKNVRVVALNEAGEALGTVENHQSRNMLWLTGKAPAQTFKYRLKPAGEAVNALVSCNGLTAAKGQKVKLHSSKLISSANWFDDSGKSYPAELAKAGEYVLCDIPEGFKDGSHVWLEINLNGQTEWLDFVAIDSFSVDIDLSSEGLKKGSPYKVKLTLTNRLAKPENFKLTSKADIKKLPAEIKVAAGSGKTIELDWKTSNSKDTCLKITAKNDQLSKTAELKVASIITKIDTGNNSFEKVDSDSVLKWGTNTAYPPVGKLVITNGNNYDGAKSLRFINNASQIHHLYSEKGFAVNGGDVVKLSAFAKGKGSFKLAVYAYNPSSQWIDFLAPEAVNVNSNDWKKENFSITIPTKSYPQKGKIARVNIAVIVDKNSDIQLDNLSGYIQSPQKVIRK